MLILASVCQYCRTIAKQYRASRAGALMGKVRRSLTCPWYDWFALILTSLSFLWVFPSIPRIFLYTVSNYKRILKMIHGLTPRLASCFMYLSVSTLPFCWVPPIPTVREPVLRSSVSVSELGRIKIMLRRVHCVDWRSEEQVAVIYVYISFCF